MKWIKTYFELIGGFYSGSLRYIKYQMITKTLYALVVMPLFWLVVHGLIAMSGRALVSSSGLKDFLLTKSGLVFVLIGLILVILSLLVEVCGFINIAALVMHGREESSYWELFKFSLKQLPKLLGFSLILMLIYFAVFIPLSDIGLSLSIFDFIVLPKFVYSVIEASTAKLLAYFAATLLASFFAVKWVFSFHFVLLGNMKLSKAMKASSQLIARNFKYFLQLVLIISVMMAVSMALLALLWLLPITLLVSSMNLENYLDKSVVMGVLLTQEMGLTLLGLLYFPFEVYHLTWVFYKLVDRDPVFNLNQWDCPDIPIKAKPTTLDRWLNSKRFVGIAIVFVIVIGAGFLGVVFDRMTPNQEIQVMSHRAGGFSAPENSISGVRYAIASEADWIEIDVQRTKDGKYILFHDDDLIRTAGVKQRLDQLTYEEIEQYTIGREIGLKDTTEKIPLLSDVLDLCKGKIRVNIELKGKSADQKMVKDVIGMLRSKRMTREVMLTSLDYDLIALIEKDYPNFETGFIYFFMMGDPSRIKADVLILEEGAATSSMISKIHSVGKKAIVWTINDEAAMIHYAESEVDGIITDRPEMLNTVLKEHSNYTDHELILNTLWQIE